MTLEEFYKATEGMPKDAPIMKVIIDKGVFITPITSIEYDDRTNWITIC